MQPQRSPYRLGHLGISPPQRLSYQLSAKQARLHRRPGGRPMGLHATPHAFVPSLTYRCLRGPPCAACAPCKLRLHQSCLDISEPQRLCYLLLAPQQSINSRGAQRMQAHLCRRPGGPLWSHIHTPDNLHLQQAQSGVQAPQQLSQQLPAEEPRERGLACAGVPGNFLWPPLQHPGHLYSHSLVQASCGSPHVPTRDRASQTPHSPHRHCPKP